MATNNKKPLSESAKRNLSELRAAVKMVKTALTQLRAAKPSAKSAAASNARAAAAAAIKIVANLDKPKSRGGRLVEAEAQVKAARPKDARLVWRDMT
jgi:hypothetical protein